MIKKIIFTQNKLEILNENEEISLKMNHQFEELGGFCDDFFVVSNRKMIEVLNENGELISSIEKGNRELINVAIGFIYILNGGNMEQYNRELTFIKKYALEDFSI